MAYLVRFSFIVLRLYIGYATVSNRNMFLLISYPFILGYYPLITSVSSASVIFSCGKYAPFNSRSYYSSFFQRPINFLRGPISDDWSWIRLESPNISFAFTVINQYFNATSFFFFSFSRWILNNGLYWLERLPMPILYAFSATSLGALLTSVSLILFVWWKHSFLSFHIVWHSVHPDLIALTAHKFPVRLLFFAVR